MANAEDHRNDIFISALTLLSIITGYYNIYIIDAIAGLLISLWIAYTGFKIFISAYDVLMDTTIETSIKREMEALVNHIDGVDHIDSINSKPVGLSFLLIVKVSVDANLTVYEGHEISNRIKSELMSYSSIHDVLVHLNPTQYHP
jgi:cation diffusion facilitator family transporter